MREEAERARELAREAGALAAGLQGRVPARDKGGGKGPVTDADLAVERLVLDGLGTAFPEDAVLSEETRPEVALPVRRLWCVDPIDGTREYVQGTGEFVSQIGLLVDGEPLVGAISLPRTREVVWGYRGGGVWIDGPEGVRPLSLPSFEDLSRATVVHSRHHLNAGLRRALASLGAAQLVPAGGVGYKATLVLLGRAHVYLHTGRGTSWWDSVAPAALVLAAGGTATDARGRAFDYTVDVRHRQGLLFAAPGLLGPVLARLRHGRAGK